ncbi:MAG: DUF262 domain-containing protein [Bacteroidales bacterium]|nr:DUF262 domain-containing protein [Bacteroidales bacterium]
MKKHFFIPDYQRGYRWEEKQIYQLLEDLWKYFKDGMKKPSGFYCLQPIVAKKCSQETIEKYHLPCLTGIEPYDNEEDAKKNGPRNDTWYEIIDGQQRLTTIRILLAFYKAVNPFGKCDFYELRYATRPEFKDIFSSIVIDPANRTSSISKDFTFHNIDVEYVKNCTKAIIYWFSEDSFVESNKFNKIVEFLSNFYNDASQDVNVQVIWYETTERTDARDVFERLNNLKVPLSSSELIRAIFLSNTAQYKCTLTEIQKAFPEPRQQEIRDEDKKRKQSSINAKWDKIEHFFRNDQVWGFITEKDASEYRNRIEILFDLMSEKYSTNDSSAEKDRLHTFLWFDSQKKDLWDLWGDVVKYYDTIRFWHEDRNYYHKIGYLIHEKHDSILVSLLKFANSNQNKRSAFNAELDKQIRATIGTSEKFSDLSYDDARDYKVLKSLLFLYNVEYSRLLKNGELFNFDQYKTVEKKGQWTLEHIHAQNSECLDATDRKEWRDWIAYTIAARKSIINPTPEILSFISELEAEKAVLDKEFETKVFREKYESIVVLFKKDLDLWSGGQAYTVLHQLSNLALLSGDINSGIGKGSFSAKQQYINKCIADGRFIPICTKRVFLKHYYDAEKHSKTDEASNLLNQQLYTWDDKDRACYLEDIKKVLSTYFASDKF